MIHRDQPERQTDVPLSRWLALAALSRSRRQPGVGKFGPIAITPLALTVLLGVWTFGNIAPTFAQIRDHDIKLPASDRAAPGERRALSLTIMPRSGYTISQQAPVVVDVRVRPDQGLQLAKHRYRRRDAADARAEAPRFDLGYRAINAGRYTVTADIRFWVCARNTCRPVRASYSVAVAVTGSKTRAPSSQSPP